MSPRNEKVVETKSSEEKKSSSVLTLIIYVSGIYAAFLSWGYLQEKISTKNYSLDPETPVYFKSPLVINIIQSFFAVIIGSIYLSFKTSKFQTPFSFLFNDFNLFKSFLIIAITQAISSPVSYSSLGHVNYLVFLLAKSCKLIPVMIVHWAMYRKKFPFYKYVVAIIVTLGVVTFTFGNQSGKKSSSSVSEDGNLLLGLSLLIISLLLDGLTNSTQDQLFINPDFKNLITGAHLMCGLNLLNMSLTFGYTALFTNELQSLVKFIDTNGYSSLIDVMIFGLCGSIGQIFIFATLEKFDSIVLVTVTVTRKMISMCLSVFIFGHSLKFVQWLGIFLVFMGIIAESVYKVVEKKQKKVKVTTKEE